MIMTLFPAGALLVPMQAVRVTGMQMVSLLDVALFFAEERVPPGLERHTLPDAGPLVLPVAVPLLPGMDAVEVDEARLTLAGGSREVDAPGVRTAAGEIDVRLPGGDPTATLKRLRVEGFQLTAAASLAGIGTGPALHMIVQLLEGARAGPPAAAAPHFAMPGGGGARYGPALGGASLSASAASGGATSLTLGLSPQLAGEAFRVALVMPGEDAALPNESTGWPHWSMSGATATFRTRPRDVAVTLAGPGGAPAAVANFPGAMPADATAIDLTPAMRAMARAAMGTATGGDLGLSVQIVAAAGGDMLAAIARPRVRYVKRPLISPEPLALRGRRGELRLAVPAGLVPNGLSLAIDGRYGIPRLLDCAALPTGRLRTGYRLVPGRRVAMPVLLTSAEQLLPLRRLAAFGRAEAPAALLLGLADGIGAVPGAAHGEAVAVPVVPATEMDWHRGEWQLPALAAPHQERLFLTIEVTHGAFLLAVDPAAGGDALFSEGGGWTPALAPPLMAAWVDEADPATGAPAPLHPLDLDGPSGPLNRDVAGVAGGLRPPNFVLNWLAVAPAHAAMLAAVGDAGGDFALGFSCRRDVDLTLSDVMLTYDPWGARAPGHVTGAAG